MVGISSYSPRPVYPAATPNSNRLGTDSNDTRLAQATAPGGPNGLGSCEELAKLLKRAFDFLSNAPDCLKVGMKPPLPPPYAPNPTFAMFALRSFKAEQLRDLLATARSLIVQIAWAVNCKKDDGSPPDRSMIDAAHTQVQRLAHLAEEIEPVLKEMEGRDNQFLTGTAALGWALFNGIGNFLNGAASWIPNPFNGEGAGSF
jgi:hypothetical protein